MADVILILGWLALCAWMGGGIGFILGVIVVILIGGSR